MTLAGWITLNIPAICPAITLPLVTSPSTTAALNAPEPSASISSGKHPCFSSFKNSLESWFLSERTGCPVLLPVTTASMSLALMTLSL